MTKKFTILLILSFLLLTGCSSTKQQEATNEDLDFEELFAEIDKEEEQKLQPICDQEMIPAEYASDCYFRTLKDCEILSGKTIPKSELEKCLPIFLRDEIQDR